MESLRLCSRPACRESARATLTYNYADSTAVLGPLAQYPEPHCYDLCARHANRLTVPSGWNLLRGALPDVIENEDELHALMNAVREDRKPREATETPAPRELRGTRFDARPRLAMLPPETDER
ncbi:DUF3499 domain-containing protein [Glutamicibacter bergerei]|uniref:DUF3499 domain-containing protein n=1 Tax=Glutamicibacter TaxID=1742989 RepID=UPI000BB84B4A|nr:MULTISPECIES: DUF3499 domain-containing protein [Glutamicibacter]PCC33216.1 hypothetical protein CIK74_12820 [Glutamicibacter sp. BW77]